MDIYFRRLDREAPAASVRGSACAQKKMRLSVASEGKKWYNRSGRIRMRKRRNTMSDILDRANDHLRKHAGKIDLSQRPRYHLAPPVGWMNDPNGVCSFGGETHIFYQYFPYDSCWGPMHWGHAVTRDNCVFRHCAVALAPDREDESGCFSGGAVVSETGELFVYYTKHFEADGVRKELQGMVDSIYAQVILLRLYPQLPSGSQCGLSCKSL